MRLRKVTLTGADDSIEPIDLVDLTERYSFVEWGILFSPRRQGVESRYPSYDWLRELHQLAMLWKDTRSEPFPISAHLCGGYTKDYNGLSSRYDSGFQRWSTSEVYPLTRKFQRVQFNIGSTFNEMDLEAFDQVINYGRPTFEPIIQVRDWGRVDEVIAHDSISGIPFSLLYDRSGGTGESPDSWLKPPKGIHVGYAGGIGPDNVEEVLYALEEVCEDETISIDMESKLRGFRDSFDLKKADEVLAIASRWR